MDHPVTGLPFNYDKACSTCALFTDKKRTVRGVKYRTIRCALDPEQRNLADVDINVVWKSIPACSQHTTS